MNYLFESINMLYNDFVEWYLLQPIFAQIFVIIGIIVILALAVTLVYYIIKGIAYLVYYILKGVFYLLRGIGFAFFKLFEGFYNIVSGKTKFQQKRKIISDTAHITNNDRRYDTIFCSECGKKFSEKMVQQLDTANNAFCVSCGKEYRIVRVQEPIIRTL